MTPSRDSTGADPFGPTLAPGGLYVSHTLQQRIDLIEHLLEFGRQLIVLSGQAGSGKTTLLHAIGAAAGERWACVQVQGGPALSGRALLSQIADALDVDLSADSEPRMAQTMLRLRLNVLERAGKLVVLLVDDADQLAPDAVAALVALARTEDQTAEARVLMAADHDHAGLLANLQRDRPQHGLVHVVEIPPVSDNHVGDFLAQRLAVAGEALEERLSAADVAAIASAAGGNPARIVALARQQLAGREAAPRHARRRLPKLPHLPKLPRLPKLDRLPRLPSLGGLRLPRPGLTKLRLPRLGDRRVLPLFLLPPIVAVGAWLLLRDAGDEAPASSAPMTIELPPADAATGPADDGAGTPPPAAETTAATPGESPATGGERELIQIELPDEPPRAAGDEGANVEAAPVPDAELPPAAEPEAAPSLAAAPGVRADTAPDPKPAVEPVPVAAPEPAPAPRPSPSPKPTPPAPAPASKPADGSGGIASTEWLLKQARGSYTLQLAGVRDRTAAQRFIQRHGLAGKAAILSTRRDNQAWYVLVLGHYPNRQAALAAATKLPPALLKEVKPWARTVGDLAALPR